MFTGKNLHYFVVIATLLLLFSFSVLTPSRIRAEQSSAPVNLLQGTPVVTKLIDNVSTPNLSKAPCTNMTIQVARNVPGSLVASPETRCMVSTSAGFISNDNSVILPLGFSKAYPFRIARGGQPVLIPVNGTTSALMITGDYAYPGANIGFYDNLYSHLDFSNNPLNMSFTLNDAPTSYFKYPNGRLLAANVSGTMSFSDNGRYMVVDAVTLGFVRIDLLTHEMTTFAPNLPLVNDSGLLSAATAISSSGRYAAIGYSAPGGWGSKYFKIIDIDSCGNASGTYAASSSTCKSVDYYSALKQAVPTLSTMDEISFADENSLLVTARYDHVGSNYKEAVFAITPTGQQARKVQYLALGDSYISGEGAGNYLDGTDTNENKCHQSLSSYPYLLGIKLSSFASVACSGATTVNVKKDNDLNNDDQFKNGLEPTESQRNQALDIHQPGVILQSDFVKKDNPEAVTISIGGNDVGFNEIVKRCIAPFNSGSSLSQNCYQTYEDRLELVNTINNQFDNLAQTYSTLKGNSLRRVYVIGYPQIVDTEGQCGRNVRLSQSDREFATQLTSYLNSVIKRAAAKAGVAYVDTESVFDGYRLCDNGQKAVNGITKGDDTLFGLIGNESYHPNQLGHELLAEYIGQQTDNLTTPMPEAKPDTVNPGINNNIPLLQAPKANRVIYEVVSAGDDLLNWSTRGTPYAIGVDSLKDVLKANSLFDVVLRSDPTQLGSLQTDNSGNLNGSVQIPSSITPGFHTIHIYGKNRANDPIDIQKTIYVEASAEDYDGDGVANASDACPSLLNSGVDYDGDGIDDACDPVIGPAPIAPPVVVPPAESAKSVDQTVQSLEFVQSTTPADILVQATAVPTTSNPFVYVALVGATTVPGLSVASRADAATSQVLGTTSQTEPSIDSLVVVQQEKSKTSRATVVGVAYAGTVVALLAILLAVRRLKDRSF